MTTASALVALTFAAPHAGGGARACEGQQCPRVTVQCPERATAGDVVTYVSSVDGLEGNVTLTYKWTTSAGTISSGSDTPSVTVLAPGVDGIDAEATVEVGGLPDGCPRIASCSTNVQFACRLIRDYDSYGDLSWADEKARLDNYAVELKNVPEGRGYIVAYGGRVGRAGEARRRADRAKDYLVKTHGIDASRVLTIDGGYREELTTQVLITPPDATTPEPQPTVDPTEVKFIKEPSAPRPSTPRRARRPNR